ncbi:unnamed protein product [Microthlaspi erraticum]|uniref:Uncharacterized protein n=1 Tax=Microthlaspi erraticum TaxID=1685480 RepID=A0A6D2HPS1_9BRAS|nr:unnamed protein product [Microthlaspi erraticum]
MSGVVNKLVEPLNNNKLTVQHGWGQEPREDVGDSPGWAGRYWVFRFVRIHQEDEGVACGENGGEAS